jgi:hypothetical protein
MNCIEFETTLARLRSEHYRHVRCDIVRDGFRPVSGAVADFAVIERAGVFHFFYIERRLVEGTPFYPGNEIYFGHASTRTFLEWDVHDPVLLIRPGTWEGAHVWAPNVLEIAGRFVMAYTGVNDGLSQDIGIATSDDLLTWTRSERNPLRLCSRAPWAFWRADGIASCRDPHLVVSDGAVWMCYTANTREGASCIALARARDASLAAWEDRGPILVGPAEGYEPSLEGRHPQGSLESALLEHRCGRWILVVNAARRGAQTRTWVHTSDRMDRFELGQGRELWSDAGCVEIVRERGSRALLAGVSAGVVRLGVVDWAADRPVVRSLAESDELGAWL